MPEKIFLFGQSGSGKSTVAALVALYFFDKEGFVPRVNPKNPIGARYLFEEWITRLRSGYFPRFTDEKIRRIDVGYEQKRTGKRRGLTFFEIAGEKVRSIDPSRKDHSDLDPEVIRCLDEASIILIVGSTEPEVGDRFLLHMFLEVLAAREDMFGVPVGFIVTKWDRVDKSLSPQAFVKDNYSEALGVLSSAFPNSELFVFSAGTVEISGSDARVEVDFSAGTERLVEWIRRVSQEEA